MVKRQSAVRAEARERAQKRNAAKLKAVQDLIDKSARVFEVDVKVSEIDGREEQARDRAKEKYERELVGIGEKFEKERADCARERAEAVRDMLAIPGATIKDVAEAVDLSAAEVRRIKNDAPPQEEQLPEPSTEQEEVSAPVPAPA